MKYKIREMEMLLNKAGEPIGKKMVLKNDEQQNEEPRVTVWNDHPECEGAKVGGTISGTMEKKDSGVPIPAHPGKNYINRTLRPETNPNGTIAVNSPELATRVSLLEKKVFGDDGIDAEDMPF